MSLPEFPADLLAPAIICAAAGFLAGLARGFSGFGAAMIFVPVASAVLGPVVAMPVLLIADIADVEPDDPARVPRRAHGPMCAASPSAA